MKKNLLTIFAVLTVYSSLSAKDNKWSVDLQPCFGFRNGTFIEYVYSKNSLTGQEYHLSQLNWNIKNSAYLGASVETKISSFNINAEIKGFIPDTSGNMDDSDWLQDAGYKTGNSSIKTNYSEHTLDFTQGLNFDIFASYEFKCGKVFSISPAVGFTYERYSFDGIDGNYWYGYNKLDRPQSELDKGHYYSYDALGHRKAGVFSGKVISLTRDDYYTWLGVKAKIKTSDERWIFTLNAFVSPYTFIDTRDHHWLNRSPNGTYYADLSTGYFSAFKGNISAAFMFNKTAGIKATFNALYTLELHGVEYITYSENGKYEYSNSNIGAGSKYFDYQLSAVIKF